MSDLYFMSAMWYMGFFIGLARDDELSFKDFGLVFIMGIFWPVTLIWCAWHQWKERRNARSRH